MPKVGRNDPCPCGSGKKYKHCCLGREKIIPFPGTDAGDQAGSFEEYKRFVESYDGPGEPPSFMQWRGMPNPATDFIQGMRREIGDRVFDSPEQLKEFVDDYQARENTAPLEDFLGLSPDVMHRILHNTASGNTDFLALSSAIPDEELLRVPVMEQVLRLLGKLSEAGSIKATAKGNFPPAVVQDLYEAVYRKYQEVEYKPKNEDDLRVLTIQKNLLKQYGLIRMKSSHFSLTKKAADLLEKRQFNELYKILFYAWLEGFNWDYLDRSGELSLMQTAALFGLYILKKKAADFISSEGLGRFFLAAFPELEGTVESHWDSPDEHIIRCFRRRFLRRFCASFGLVEVKTEGKDLLDREYFYKTTDFFKKHLVFNM